MSDIYSKMAAVLAKRLTDEELVRLSEVMDGDSTEQLWVEINKVVRKHHPELFCHPLDPPMVGT